MITKMTEALGSSAHIYEVSKDGIPELGRVFITFLTSNHENYILAERCDYKPSGSETKEADWHKGPGGAFYADKGKGGQIYGMDFERYIYVDELNLIPQSHHDKVAERNSAKEVMRDQLTQKLTSIYGTEYGNKLAKAFIYDKYRDSVELIGSAKYLLEAPGYAGCYEGLYEQLCKYFTEDEAQELFFQIPYVANVLDSYPDRIYFDLSNANQAKINYFANKPFNWLLGKGYISGIDTDGETLIVTPISSKCNESDLLDYFRRKEGLSI